MSDMLAGISIPSHLENYVESMECGWDEFMDKMEDAFGVVNILGYIINNHRLDQCFHLHAQFIQIGVDIAEALMAQTTYLNGALHIALALASVKEWMDSGGAIVPDSYSATPAPGQNDAVRVAFRITTAIKDPQQIRAMVASASHTMSSQRLMQIVRKNVPDITPFIATARLMQ